MKQSPSVSTREFALGKTKSIDSLRGVAVILMLFYHFLVWLLEISARGHFFRGVQVLATFFAPATFFIVTGVTLALSVMRQQYEGKSSKAIGLHVLQRYGSLILIGFVLNAIVWGYRSIWIWDVLEVIGICNILAFLALLSSMDLVLILTGLLGLGSFYLVRSIHLPPLVEAILHNPLNGTFPIGPFLVFTVAGVIFGRRFIHAIRSREPNKAWMLCLKVGIILLLGGLILHMVGVPIARYPISISYLSFATGVCLLVLGGLFWWQDFKEYRARLLAPVMIYGRYALSIYIGHYLIYRLFVFAGLGRELFLPQAVIASLVLFVLILGLVVYIRPKFF